jgi:hypothetical protein
MVVGCKNERIAPHLEVLCFMGRRVKTLILSFISVPFSTQSCKQDWLRPVVWSGKRERRA